MCPVKGIHRFDVFCQRFTQILCVLSKVFTDFMCSVKGIHRFYVSYSRYTEFGLFRSMSTVWMCPVKDIEYGHIFIRCIRQVLSKELCRSVFLSRCIEYGCVSQTRMISVRMSELHHICSQFCFIPVVLLLLLFLRPP